MSEESIKIAPLPAPLQRARDIYDRRKLEGWNCVRIGTPMPPYGLVALEWQPCGCHLLAIDRGFTLTPCELHRAIILEIYDPSIGKAFSELAAL